MPFVTLVGVNTGQKREITGDHQAPDVVRVSFRARLGHAGPQARQRLRKLVAELLRSCSLCGSDQKAVRTNGARIFPGPPASASAVVIFGARRVMRAPAAIAPQSTANAKFSRETFTMASMVDVAAPLSAGRSPDATATCVYA